MFLIAVNLLLRYLRNERRLKISAVHSPPNPQGLSVIEEFPSRIPLAELRYLNYNYLL